MKRAIDKFFKRWGEVCRSIPVSAWLFALLSQTISSALDVFRWSQPNDLVALTSIAGGVSILLICIAVYVGCWKFVGRPKSAATGTPFILTFILSVAPALLSVYLLNFLAKGSAAHSGIAIATILILVFVGGLASFLLVAWPIAQGISAKLISPLKVIEATRGHRWALIVAGITINSATNSHFIPDISTADQLLGAALIASANVLMGLFQIGATIGVIVTAWEFAGARSKRRAREARHPGP